MELRVLSPCVFPAWLILAFCSLKLTKLLAGREKWTTGRSNSYPEVHCSFIMILLSFMFLLKRWHFLLNSDISKYKANILPFFWNIWFSKQVTNIYFLFHLLLQKRYTNCYFLSRFNPFFPLYRQVDEKAKVCAGFSFQFFMFTINAFFERLIKSQTGIS